MDALALALVDVDVNVDVDVDVDAPSSGRSDTAPASFHVRPEASLAYRRGVTARLRWKVGFELELLAPRGSTRLDLARALARAHDAQVRRCFHRSEERAPTEPRSPPPAAPLHTLTPGFEVCRRGEVLFRLVDDITLQADLDASAPARPGWYRIVCDDARLLALAAHHCDASATRARVLDPLRRLFVDSRAQSTATATTLRDEYGLPLYLAAPYGGERERTCEIVTAPLTSEHAGTLARVLAVAAAHGFTAPAEGASHLHFDASSLRSAATVRALVLVLHAWREPLRALVHTNPRCTRLGEWPRALLELVAPPAFATLAWPDARRALLGVGLTKYCDVNLLNLLRHAKDKLTVEWRILPVPSTVEPLMDAAVVFERLLRWAREPGAAAATRFSPRPPTRQAAVELLTLVGVAPDVSARLLATVAEPEGGLERWLTPVW